MQVTELQPATDAWAAAWDGPLMWGLAGVVGGCVVVLIMAARAVWVTGRGGGRGTTPARGSGTATVEFALVAPVAMFVLLLLCQITMLMVGNIFVNYAAFAATRTATLVIPTDRTGEGPNEFAADAREPDSKHGAIHRTAAFALAPISGVSDAGGDPVVSDYVAAIGAHYEAYGLPVPQWVENRLAGRLSYALEATEILLMRTVVDGSTDPPHVDFTPLDEGFLYTFDAREPITVRITHEYYLGVPYINRLLARVHSDDDSEPTWTIRARSTLTNMGIRPDLPPRPEVERL